MDILAPIFIVCVIVALLAYALGQYLDKAL